MTTAVEWVAGCPGFAAGRPPNSPFHPTAATHRFGVTVRGHDWAAVGDRATLGLLISTHV